MAFHGWEVIFINESRDDESKTIGSVYGVGAISTAEAYDDKNKVFSFNNSEHA